MFWSREERSLAAALAVLALAGAGWLLAGRVAATGAADPSKAGAEGVEVGGASPSPTAGSGAVSGEAGGDAGETRAGDAPEVLVHVAGSVREPGVYRLPAGARAIDAVNAAGGPTDDAAVDAVNLAAPVVDGSRLYIPSRAEVAEHGPAGFQQAAGFQQENAGAAPPGGDAAVRPVDINRAGPSELERLPGIGPVLAQRIVDYRQRHGPFRTVDDLLAVSGIGPKVLERLRPYVVVP